MMTKTVGVSVTRQIVQEGLHQATMIGSSRYHNAYGERIGFEFLLHGNGSDGMRIRMSAAPHLSPKSKLAEILRGLLGRDLSEQELGGAVNYSDLVGRPCAVMVVTESDRSGNKYSTIGHVFSYERMSR